MIITILDGLAWVFVGIFALSVIVKSVEEQDGLGVASGAWLVALLVLRIVLELVS